MKEQICRAKKDKINFIIPDFMNVDECVYLIDTFRSHNEIFMDKVNILGFTGQFNGCVWNEQKKFDMYKLKIDILEKIKEKYKKLGVSLVIIFDKINVEVNELDDIYCNEIMKIFNDENNYVICYSSKLKLYIKENYKKIQIIDFMSNNQSSVGYNIVDPKFNKDKKLFQKGNKDRLILLPDLGSIPNKKWMFKHKKNESVLNKINPKKDKYYTKTNSLSFYELRKNENYLSYEDLKEYVTKGINLVMLSGLGVYNYAMYENIVSYIYKEEYRFDARNNYLQSMLKLKEHECLAINNYEL